MWTEKVRLQARPRPTPPLAAVEGVGDEKEEGECRRVYAGGLTFPDQLSVGFVPGPY
jgi:hypothetical protein